MPVSSDNKLEHLKYLVNKDTISLLLSSSLTETFRYKTDKVSDMKSKQI